VNRDNEVRRNWIHHVGQAPYWHSPAVTLYGSSHNHITLNLIHDAPYCGVSIAGTMVGHLNSYAKAIAHPDSYGGVDSYYDTVWESLPEGSRERADEDEGTFTRASIKPFLNSGNNTIEYNVIVDVMQKLHDGGHLYCWACGLDNVWRRNALRNRRNTGLFVPIYMDDEVDKASIHDNVAYSPGKPMNKGDNDWINNMFTTDRPYYYDLLLGVILDRVAADGGWLGSPEAENARGPAGDSDTANQMVMDYLSPARLQLIWTIRGHGGAGPEQRRHAAQKLVAMMTHSASEREVLCVADDVLQAGASVERMAMLVGRQGTGIESVNLLSQWLGEENEKARHAVVRALLSVTARCRTDHPLEVNDVLAKMQGAAGADAQLLKELSEARAECARLVEQWPFRQQLATAPDETAARPLLRRLLELDTARELLVADIGRIGASAQTAEILAPLLEHEEASVRHAAVRALLAVIPRFRGKNPAAAGALLKRMSAAAADDRVLAGAVVRAGVLPKPKAPSLEAGPKRKPEAGLDLDLDLDFGDLE
jgi:hypothetical protein